VDFLAPGRGGRLQLIEVKWSKTLRPDIARSLLRLAGAIRGKQVEAVLVHRAPRSGPKLGVLAPGITALSVEDFLDRGD
jgi:hypothetical protein